MNSLYCPSCAGTFDRSSMSGTKFNCEYCNNLITIQTSDLKFVNEDAVFLDLLINEFDRVYEDYSNVGNFERKVNKVIPSHTSFDKEYIARFDEFSAYAEEAILWFNRRGMLDCVAYTLIERDDQVAINLFTGDSL